MIMQLGTLLSSVFGGAPGASLTSVLGGVASRAVSALAPVVINAGQQFATGLINRELNRSSRNDFEDAIKAQLRAATNAVSPTAAIGQTAVYSGGPATGTAFAPATLLPPSIQPPQRILQTNPAFFGGRDPQQFDVSRRPPDQFVGARVDLGRSVPITNVGLGSEIIKALGRFGGRAAGRVSRTATAFDPRTPIGRRMLGVAAGGAAVQTGAGVALDFAFPDTAFAPGTNGFPTTGAPLRIGGDMPVMTQVPTGLPATGNFQREANGCFVQWFFWDGDMGTNPQPIDRGQAACLKRDCIYRLNVFTGKFVKLKGRRMNPMNVRAFFRAGRRVDAGERICRKMFSEHRKTRTGTIRRKRSRKKK